MLSSETTLILVSHIGTACFGALTSRSPLYTALASVLLLALVYQRFTDSLMPILATCALCFVYMASALVVLFRRQKPGRLGRRQVIQHDAIHSESEDYTSDVSNASSASMH